MQRKQQKGTVRGSVWGRASKHKHQRKAEIVIKEKASHAAGDRMGEKRKFS